MYQHVPLSYFILCCDKLVQSKFVNVYASVDFIEMENLNG